MKQIALLMLIALLVSGMQRVYAQETTIKGVVTAQEDGLPLPGVTVLQKGTQNGTITDFEGNYSIRVPKGAILTFSFMGYQTEEVAVSDQVKLDIAMKQETKMIEEVQVIGYGAKKKRDIVGSVATVKSEEIQKVTSTDFTEGMQGTAAGVFVSANNGTAGSGMSIKIRGLSSINLNTDPLWVIDGVISHSGGNLINANDIESVNILKDASATAIYGSRGSNGVIIITTKSGKNGCSKPQTTINYSYGRQFMSKPYTKMGLANTTDWLTIVDKGLENAGLGKFDPSLTSSTSPLRFFSQTEKDPVTDITRSEIEAVNTDWFDQVLRVGEFQNMNFSTTGGFEKGNFYLSANYKNQKSVIDGNDYTSMTARSNINYEVFKNFSMNTKMQIAHANNQKVRGGTGWGGSFGAANEDALPWYPIDNVSHPTEYWNPMSGNNMVANKDRTLVDDWSKSYRGIATVQFEYKMPWVKGLKIKSDVGIDFSQSHSVSWTSAYMNEKGSQASDNTGESTILTYNLYANYNKDFGAPFKEDKKIHNIDVTVGTESQENSGWSRSMSGRNMVTIYHEIGSVNPYDLLDMSSYLSGEKYLRAYFGRADYKLYDRYIAGVSFRRDGSSKFYGDNVWGTFTAFSGGWIVNEERFFPFPQFNLLKLRGSYGQTGNEGVPSNLFIDRYSISKGNVYGVYDALPGGTTISNAGNPLITWETTSSYDFGIDFGLYKNRLNGSVAYYMQDVTDLLLETPLPPSAPVGSYWSNIGDMKNWGWEFSISTTNIDRPLSDFRWTTDFNISTNDNRVMKLIDQAGSVKYGGASDARTITIEDQRLHCFFMADYAGVDKEKGVEMIWEIDQDTWENETKTVKTGKKIPATQTNLENNEYIHEDKTPNPRYFGGISNKFEYRNWDINIRLTFAGGHYIYDYLEHRQTQIGTGDRVLKEELVDNSWTPDNKTADYPQLTWNYTYYWDMDDNGNWIYVPEGVSYNNKSVMYSRFLYKGDYLKLKSLEIGYKVPQEWVARAGMNNVRLYFNATNLLTWAFYFKGWDPETGSRALPPLRTFNVGASMSF
jgi:TonB-linked SusC/RagA family outer membrane protein